MSTIRTIIKAYQLKAPSNITKLFDKKYEENRPIRQPYDIKIQNPHTRIYGEMPKIWNELPEEIKTNNISYQKLIKTIRTKITTEYNNSTCTKPYCHICGI